jgi:hypothetical protein
MLKWRRICKYIFFCWFFKHIFFNVLSLLRSVNDVFFLASYKAHEDTLWAECSIVFNIQLGGTYSNQTKG